MTGPQGSTGPAGPAPGFKRITGPAGSGISMLGPTGPIGPVGPTGPRGSTGIPNREVFYPSKEGRTVSRVEAGDHLVELRVTSSSSVMDFGIYAVASIGLLLTKAGEERMRLCSWEAQEIYMKEPEDMARTALSVLTKALVDSFTIEVLSAMFLMARKEAMRMLAILYSELLISHVTREEMAEAWDEANVLRVMTE